MVKDLSKRQLVLTNYETLRTYQLSICAVHFSLVILDEAQRIKTPGTLITSVSKARECESDSITMLRFIQLVKEISDHPFLTDKSLDEYSAPDLVESSAKLQALVRIFRHIEDLKEKVIVFAERRETQRMIQRVVYELYGFMPHIINGDTPSSSSASSKARQSRQQTISVFNKKEGFNVLVLSPIAAGVGLNITAANHVVHYSRHRNRLFHLRLGYGHILGDYNS